ncbi:MAG: hypothetical protein HQ483_02835 [Rhodospirillales bacterium]|nr:hypothetical protein [Rhodospirillales bacterium]
MTAEDNKILIQNRVIYGSDDVGDSLITFLIVSVAVISFGSIYLYFLDFIKSEFETAHHALLGIIDYACEFRKEIYQKNFDIEEDKICGSAFTEILGFLIAFFTSVVDHFRCKSNIVYKYIKIKDVREIQCKYYHITKFQLILVILLWSLLVFISGIFNFISYVFLILFLVAFILSIKIKNKNISEIKINLSNNFIYYATPFDLTSLLILIMFIFKIILDIMYFGSINISKFIRVIDFENNDQFFLFIMSYSLFYFVKWSVFLLIRLIQAFRLNPI